MAHKVFGLFCLLGKAAGSPNLRHATSAVHAKQLAEGVQVSSGDEFTLLVDTDGYAWGLGYNEFGQLGVGMTENLVVAGTAALPSDVSVVSAKAGGSHSLFLTSTGAVYAAGSNRFGQLGKTADSTTHPTPEMVFSSGVKAIDAGSSHSLFLMENGDVKCAGKNSAGQCGDNTFAHTDMTDVDIPHPVQAIACGYDFSYFVTTDGEIWSVGQNTAGQLGDGFRTSRSEPKKVLFDQVAVAAGESHAIFLDKLNVVRAVGAASGGQLGIVDPPINVAHPRSVPFSHTESVSKLAAGGDSSCLVTNTTVDGEKLLYGFGSNRWGQLGKGNTMNIEMPEALSETSVTERTLTSLDIGTTHSMFASSSGRIWGTGQNTFGQLGDGSTTDRTDFSEAVIDFTQTSRTTTIYDGPSTSRTSTTKTTTSTTTTATSTTDTTTSTTITSTTVTTSTTTVTTLTTTSTTTLNAAAAVVGLDFWYIDVNGLLVWQWIVIIGIGSCVCFCLCIQCRRIDTHGGEIDENQEEVLETEMVVDKGSKNRGHVEYEPEKTQSSTFNLFSRSASQLNNDLDIDAPPVKKKSSSNLVGPSSSGGSGVVKKQTSLVSGGPSASMYSSKGPSASMYSAKKGSSNASLSRAASDLPRGNSRLSNSKTVDFSKSRSATLTISGGKAKRKTTEVDL